MAGAPEKSTNKSSKNQATRHWLLLRFSGIGLFFLSLFFLFSIAMQTGSDYDAIITWVQNPFVTVFLVLFLGSIFFHLKLGLEEVIEDYVGAGTTKVTLLFFNNAFALVFGLLSIISILRIAFGV